MMDRDLGSDGFRDPLQSVEKAVADKLLCLAMLAWVLVQQAVKNGNRLLH